MSDRARIVAAVQRLCIGPAGTAAVGEYAEGYNGALQDVITTIENLDKIESLQQKQDAVLADLRKG